MEQNLTIWDLILTPVFIIVLSAIARNIRDKRYPQGHPLRAYYMPALFIKFFGAIFIGLVYHFYYGGGDTYNFFYNTRLINSSLKESFSIWFKLVIRAPYEADPRLYSYINRIYWYEDPSSYMVGAIAAIFGVFTGSNYMPTALIFAFLSFTGIWAMYRTFVNIYPKLHKELAIAFLFIPSTFVWGSSIFKDTICMFGLGWLTYTTFRIFVNRDFSLRNFFLLGLSFFLILKIKLYILLAFVPALSIWLLMTYSTKIKSVGLRFFMRVAFAAVSVGAFFFFMQAFSKELANYSLENIANTAATTRGWLQYASGDEGSAYDLGDFDPSIGGMFKKFPQAVVVTLFRPFPWEVRKVIVALSAIEAFLFLYLTLKVLFTKRKNLKELIKDPNIIFFFVFSVIFAFAVGISSFNFGALSRYKIPCLPFYGAMLAILLYKDKKEGVIVQRRTLNPEPRPQPI